MVLHEQHLRRLTRYFQYHHPWRTHRALATDYPGLQLVQQPEDGPIKKSRQWVGGIITMTNE